MLVDSKVVRFNQHPTYNYNNKCNKALHPLIYGIYLVATSLLIYNLNSQLDLHKQFTVLETFSFPLRSSLTVNCTYLQVN